jgi:uncharacterized membrane protein (Fun14 family)
MLWGTGGLEELARLIPTTIGGWPTLVVAALPFVVGLVLGFVIKKALKVAIVLVVLALLASYFGFINLGTLAAELRQYAPTALSYLSILVTILPLGVGFVIGLILGFIFG